MFDFLSPRLRFAWTIWLYIKTWFSQHVPPDGLVSCLIAEQKHLKVLSQLPGTYNEWWVLHFCFSIVLPYSHIYLRRIPYSHVYTNMLPEHRDAIHRGLWAQYMYFNGLEEAPNLTTGRPLWAVGCWEISVKSHQGFIRFWPCHNFFLVLRGTRGTVGKQEDRVHLSLLSEARTSLQTRPQDNHYKKEGGRRDKVLMNDNDFKWRHTRALFKCYQTEIRHPHISVRLNGFCYPQTKIGITVSMVDINQTFTKTLQISILHIQ